VVLTRKALSNTRPESRSCSTRSGVWPCSLLNDTARPCAKVSLERLRPSPETHPDDFKVWRTTCSFLCWHGIVHPQGRGKALISSTWATCVLRGARKTYRTDPIIFDENAIQKKSSQGHVILFITQYCLPYSFNRKDLIWS